MLDILGGEEGGTKCQERRDRLSIEDINNRYLSSVPPVSRADTLNLS